MLNEKHKEAFLHNVSLALGRNEVPKSVEPYDFTKGPQHGVMSEVQTEEEIIARFKVECDNLAIPYTEVAPAEVKDAVLEVIKNYGGGPVGLETLAATIGEEAVTLEDVYEPYLLQIGFLTRTPRGRCVTQLAYDHLHLQNPVRKDEETQLSF